MLRGQIYQENLSSILSTPSTPFYETRQACNHVKFTGHAKHASTRARKTRHARNHTKHVI